MSFVLSPLYRPSCSKLELQPFDSGVHKEGSASLGSVLETHLLNNTQLGLSSRGFKIGGRLKQQVKAVEKASDARSKSNQHI